MLNFKVEIDGFGAIPVPGLPGSLSTITALIDALKDFVSLTTVPRRRLKTIEVVEVGR